VAVFGRDEEHGGGISSLPSTLYGVYKQANEGTARIYWQDDGISSIGLRPYTVYGPGRDQGVTSAPTRAMMAVAFGQPFHIPFGGYGDYQYTDDTAKVFIKAARTPFEGADVFNLRGSVVHMREIIEAIHIVEPSAQITFDDKPLALPDALDNSSLTAALGQLPQTPLNEGVAESITLFRQAITDGRLTADRIGS
jgi:nucleoside-diphosphate-sugar epimerase